MGQQPTENNTARGLWGLYRFIDKKQPEVKWTTVNGVSFCRIVITLKFHYI